MIWRRSKRRRMAEARAAEERRLAAEERARIRAQRERVARERAEREAAEREAAELAAAGLGQPQTIAGARARSLAKRATRRRGHAAGTHPRLRRGLLLGGAAIVLGSATTLAFASRRIASEQSAFVAPAVARCEPTTLNRSATLPGTPLSVAPLPDSYDASAHTQISLLGAPAGA
ncbi:MAG TPA: hypothetical protein VK761_06985, partial [Solirubrobacteraceae bacterium]|nr:hypothetical protein [Solirubrobacteraceae bacterium]